MKRYIAWPIVLSAVLFISPQIFCDPTVIEAENFTAFADIAQKTIQSLRAPSCQGGKMLIGLDYPNEWTTYEFTLDRAGDYAIEMLCRGDKDKLFRLRLTLSPAVGDASRETGFAFSGRGYG